MTTTIAVTASHIRAGKTSSIYSCPVALALREWVDSRNWVVYITEDQACMASKSTGGYVGVRLPKVAREFVRQFDAAGVGEPFGFKLPLPPGVLREV